MAALILSILISTTSHAASVGWGSPPVTAKSAATLSSSQLNHVDRVATPSLQITLDPVTVTEKSMLAPSGKDQPLKIGFAREVPQPYQDDLSSWLSWKTLFDGSRVAAFSVSSPDAQAIRVGIDVADLPEAAEIRFFSSKNSESFGPFTVKSIRAQPTGGGANDTASTATLFWSPVIEGETAEVEIDLPASVESGFAIRVPKIQHLAYSLQYPDEKRLSDIGESESCNIDIKCHDTVPSNLSAAVAKIIFNDSTATYACTGTLLNDNDSSSWIPYFITANHCLSSQTVANTIDSYWFFERATCGGPDPTSVTHFTGGGDLLNTGTNSDFSFLRLRNTEIGSLSGIQFAGWSTLDPTGKTVVGIHHPQGDLKKWSQGVASGYAPLGFSVDGSGSHILVKWSQGVTEIGSSGSGLFAITGEQNNQQLFVGNLHGGSSSCSSPTAPDWYGRFDLTFPAISQWLKSSSGSSAYLESPQQDSFASGVGLIRGWVCQASTVEVQIDGGARQRVAYGTTREDTAATCGDTNNGFGYTFNWNRLGNGTHTLQAFADNVEFANVSFTVTTLGVDYLTGASKTYLLPNFPQTGSDISLSWSEPDQNFVISGTSQRASAQPVTVRAQSSAYLESPQQGSFESGIGLIRGWVCQASTVEVQIDGGARQQVAYGTTREDTAAVCGDTDNGFGYTFNWNRLGNGTHTVQAFVDNVEFANVSFTVTTLGMEYLTGVTKQYTLPSFPQSGSQVVVRWSEPHQNFVIVSFSGS